MSDICYDRKEAKTYEKVLDGSHVTQYQNFKK